MMAEVMMPGGRDPVRSEGFAIMLAGVSSASLKKFACLHKRWVKTHERSTTMN